MGDDLTLKQAAQAIAQADALETLITIDRALNT